MDAFVLNVITKQIDCRKKHEHATGTLTDISTDHTNGIHTGTNAVSISENLHDMHNNARNT